MTKSIDLIIFILWVTVLICTVTLLLKIPYKRINLGVCFCIYYYPFRKYGVIVQRRIQLEGLTNMQSLAMFAHEQYTLPSLLPTGIFTLITHSTILSRIERAKGIRVLSCKDAHKHSLERNYSALVGARNAKHKKFEKVQFYKIKIEKE